MRHLVKLRLFFKIKYKFTIFWNIGKQLYIEKISFHHHKFIPVDSINAAKLIMNI